MSIPNYRVVLSFDAERKVFVARAPELEHCTGEGATRGEAVDRVEKEIEAQLQNMQERGQRAPAVPTVPAAIDDSTFTGELTARVSRTLQRELTWQARQEGIDLNHLLGELLAAGLDGRRGPRRSGGRTVDGNSVAGSEGNHRGGNFEDGRGGPSFERPRQGTGARYHGIMDDRANFIEYVRGLEDGPGARPGSAARGGPQRPGGPGPGPGGGGRFQGSAGPSGGGGPGGGDAGRRRRGGRPPGDKRFERGPGGPGGGDRGPGGGDRGGPGGPSGGDRGPGPAAAASGAPARDGDKGEG